MIMEEYRKEKRKTDIINKLKEAEKEIEEHLLKAEDDIENGRVRDAREVFKEWKTEYGI